MREKMLAKFKALDRNGDGRLDLQELSVLLKRGKPTMTDRDCRSMFNIIDVDRSGRISFEEFLDWALAEVEVNVDEVTPAPEEVREAFEGFCSQFAPAGMTSHIMDNRTFAKLCKDCNLIEGRGFTRNDIDVVFAKVKARNARTIGLPEFEQALHLIAQKKGCHIDAVFRAIESSGGPTTQATQADNVRFHDDESTYTGTKAAAAAPASGAGARRGSRSASVPVGGAAERGHGHSGGPAADRSGRRAHSQAGGRSLAENATAARGGRSTPDGRRAPSPRRGGRAAAHEDDGPHIEDWPGYLDGYVDEPYHAFASRDDTMDSKDLAKLCKEGGVINRRFTSTAVDIIFQRVVVRGQRRIGLEQFKKALMLMAEEKGETLDDLCMPLARLSTGSRLANATRAHDVRFHDDMSTYTGMHVMR